MVSPSSNLIDIDFEALEKMVDTQTTMVLIQRSRGYSLRKSLNIETIKKIVEIVKFFERKMAKED